jgi:uncharacterized phage protein (TIGR02218 family)
MKSASSELIAFLRDHSTFLMADCFTFTLVDGTKLYYTAADMPVTVGTATFAAHSVLISGLKYNIAVGVDVDEQDLTIAARDADTVNGVPFLVALRTGVFDGAYLQRDRAFLSSWGPPAVAVGSVTLFHGRISTIEKIGTADAQGKVKSDLVLLNVDMPRNVYQPSCLHTFCDAQCGISKPAISVNGSAQGGSYSAVAWDGATAGTYDQGTIVFTTGRNAEVHAGIKQSDGSSLILSYPLEFEVTAGDMFVATPGCAHTLAACRAFNNSANFRGFPFVPPPEAAY